MELTILLSIALVSLCRAASIDFTSPLLLNGPYSSTSSNNALLYLNYDCPEIQEHLIDFTIPFSLELTFYTSNVNGSYYIFSRQSGYRDIFSISVNPSGLYQVQFSLTSLGNQIYITSIKASLGWNYIVFNFGLGGMGSPQYLQFTLEVRNNITASIVGASKTQSWGSILDTVNDDISVNAYDLIGHQGLMSQGQGTSRHLKGAFQSVIYTPGQWLTTAQVDSKYLTLNFIQIMQNDLKYFAKLDLMQFQDPLNQIIPDLNDMSALNPTGTNYLQLGSTPQVDINDPIELNSIGLLSSSGAYLTSTNYQISSPEYFTLEIWLRMNDLYSNPIGQESILFGKQSPLLTWDVALAQYDLNLRVYVTGKSVDIPWLQLSNETTSASQDSFGYQHYFKNTWKMIAVTFMRAKSLQSTQLAIFFDQNPPIYSIISGATYTDNPLSTTYVALNFQGVIRSLVIYYRFNYITQFNQAGLEVPISNEPFYYFIKNNTYTNIIPQCQQIYGDPFECQSCSGHAGLGSMSSMCLSSCPLNTFGHTCQTCNSLCTYCNSFSSCLEGVDTSIGYYFNTTVNQFIQCDPRCMKCIDSTNVCEFCEPSVAFKAFGTQCVYECPHGYIEDYTGIQPMCTVDLSLVTQYNDNNSPQNSTCQFNQYFNEEECIQCPLTCYTCDQYGCNSCPLGMQLTSDFQCINCSTEIQLGNASISSMTIGSLGQCIESCGKGANLGLLQCDDGNLQDGDGCSSTCQIENGWICSGGTFISPDLCFKVQTEISQISLFEPTESPLPVISLQAFYLLIEFDQEIDISAANQTISILGSNCTYQVQSEMLLNMKSSFISKLVASKITSTVEIDQSYQQKILNVQIKSNQSSLIQQQNSTLSFQGSIQIDKVLIDWINEQNQISSSNVNYEVSSYYSVVMIISFTIATIQSLLYFKPVTTQILIILYHQNILTLLGFSLTDFGPIEPLVRLFNSACFNIGMENSYFTEVIQSQLSFNRYNITAIPYLQSFRNISFTNIFLNAQNQISLWITYIIIVIPIQLTLGFSLRLIKIKLPWRVTRHISDLLRTPFFSNIIVLFIITFGPLFQSSIWAIFYHSSISTQFDNQQARNQYMQMIVFD